jgi:hypothetical protein
MRVKIEFEVDVPPVVGTEQELEDWLRFVYNDNDTINSDNPYLVSCGEPDPVFGTFDWEVA